MPVQPAYNELQAAAVVGMVANSENQNRITRTASGNIGFGQPCIRVGDHNAILATAETLEAAGGGVAVAGNTGNGTMGAVTVSAGAKEGVYRLTIITAAANAGNFELEDPAGVSVDVGTVAVAFSSGGIAFTLADGATDFAVGDQFTIAVTPTAGTADLDFLGISIINKGLDHTTVDRYEQYDNVAILTHGVIWVTAGATVAAGDPVYWIVASGKYTNVAAAGNLALPDWKFDIAGVDTGLTKIVRR